MNRSINNSNNNNNNISRNNSNSNSSNNNPPEQATALKQIYEARTQLYEQNEMEMTDLRHRLKQAMDKKKNLIEQKNVAQKNYEEASSKIVDLLDDDDDDDDNKVSSNNEEKKKMRKTKNLQNSNNINRQVGEGGDGNDRVLSPRKPAAKKSLSRPLKKTPKNYGKYMMRPKPSPPEIVDLVDDDDDNDDDNDNDNDDDDDDDDDDKKNKNDGNDDDDDDNKDVSLETTPFRQSQVQVASASAVVAAAVDRNSSSKISDSGNGSRSNQKEKTTSSTKKHPRSTSITPTNSSSSSSRVSSPNEKVVVVNTITKKKRPRSTATSMTIIRERIRPTYIPKERWLQSSIGRTREKLNTIDDMVQYIGSCKFGQSCICSKFGKVHAIVLNDEWNHLVETHDEPQLWYVGVGPGRKRDANLVAACPQTIPLFHAPKIQYNTKELFYVGHYKVLNIKEYNPPIVINDQERQLLLTFTFVEFDNKLATIINKA